MPEINYIDKNILHNGMHVQLQSWEKLLRSGSRRLGWKIGFNTSADQLRLGLMQPLVGHLTTNSVIKSGGCYNLKPGSKTLVEAELAIIIGKDIPVSSGRDKIKQSIEAFAPAIELVDVSDAPADIEQILMGNIFHETVILGEKYYQHELLSTNDIIASVKVNGECVENSDLTRYPDNFIDFVDVVAETLSQHNQQLMAGDWIITGSLIKPFEVSSKSTVELNMSPFGDVVLHID